MKHFFAGLLIGAVLAITVIYWIDHKEMKFATPYQAVLLDDNQVYYGKLSGYGTAHPILTEVYYVKSGVDPQTKETKSVLVKRRKELHGPDRMYLSTQHIVVVEPVGTASQVAKLIEQSKNE